MSEENASLSQLKTKSYRELSEIKNQMLEGKAKLEALKTQGGKAWTAELQDELDELAVSLVDVDEAIAYIMQAKPPNIAVTKEKEYVVADNEKSMVHLELVYGRRYDSNTGKEISTPFIQKFTSSEWELFKKNFARLGYMIKSVKHDPTGEAAQYVTPTKK